MKFETYKAAECKKCDDRGMIKVDENRSKSCDCGKYNRMMKEGISNQTPLDLIAYGIIRHREKGRMV